MVRGSADHKNEKPARMSLFQAESEMLSDYEVFVNKTRK